MNPSSSDSEPKLCVYGFIHETAGSSATSCFLMLKELLAAGYRIDLYHLPKMWEPGSLTGDPRLRSIEVRDSIILKIWSVIARMRPFLGPRLDWLVLTGFGFLSGLWMDFRIGSEIKKNHALAPYRSLLALNTLSPWRLAGTRVLAWPQGPPNGEIGFLLRRPLLSISLLGLPFYFLLVCGYFFKRLLVQFQHHNADVVVVGSRWSAVNWRRCGCPGRKLIPLPFVYDLEAFDCRRTSSNGPASKKNFTFLHLGRIVPRKRIDLLLEAFAQLRQEVPEARLLVIGRFGMGKSANPLLAELLSGQGIEYRESVSRSEVPSIMAQVDCVVQPSENENFGSAVAEALACGLPVVVGPTNGTRDYVPASSVVFDRYDPESLKAAMAEVMRRVRANREGVAADSRRAAEKHFSMTGTLGKLIRLIEGESPREVLGDTVERS